jgi:predicted acetyltransferase
MIHGVKVDARDAGRGGSEPGVTVRLLGTEEAKVVLPPLYEELQKARPGMYRRSEDWWTYRLFYDPERIRDGGSAIRHALAESDGEAVGYMTYRQKGNWDLLSEGEVRIRELIPISDAGYRALWHYALDIDLFPIVKYWNNPIDDPLQSLVRNGRAVATTELGDGLWVRLVDLPAALQARTYSGSGSIVLGIADSFCDWNEGTYRMTIEDGVAKCERVATESDVAMDVGTLGALYMGGRDATSLARAGLIDGDADSVARLDTLFSNSPKPWCPEIF